jgi:hypothetical protein
VSYAVSGMRCPSCGTENTPDSRFCGGCGARLSVGDAPRVAPTIKVADDARYPTPVPGPPAAFGIHDSLAPRPASSMPPAAPRGSIPPTQRPQSSMPYPRAQSPALSNPPAMSSPSLDVPVRRPTGLITAIIIIDLVLAATGAILLARGLSGKSAPAAPAGAPAPARASAPPPAAVPAAVPLPAAVPVPVPAPVPAAVPAPAPVPAPAAATGSAAAPPPPPPAAAKRPPTHPAKRSPAAKLDPQDPYATLDNEIDLTASRSQPAFDRCRASAPDVHGSIRIAFEVTPDGRVAHPAAVANTTGSAELADCIAQTIGGWTFAVHPAQATDFVRPFAYP